MPSYFLGVDTGATKSHALIADETGRAAGFGEGGPGNPQTVGYDGLREVLEAVTAQAVGMAGISREQIAGAGFGIAGYDWPSQREATLRAIQPLGLSAQVEIVNDTLVGLLAGAAEGWGVAVVAGTGENCRGWDKNRREGRVTGFGPRFGEAGGAGQLVERAIRSISGEWSRRGPPTRLSQAFVELTGARSLEDFVEGVTLGRYPVEADAAPVVFRVAAEGDLAAQDAIRWAGCELGDMAVGVIRQLGFEALTFEVVLVGSLYNGGSLLVEPMRATIHAVAPGARLVPLTAPPVAGGVLLGMERAGLDAPARRETLIQSTHELLRPRL